MSNILFKDIYRKHNHKYTKIDKDYLTEEDFYPPEDNRVLKSYVRDIYGGDNFSDYCRYIFNVLDEEEYYDD